MFFIVRLVKGLFLLGSRSSYESSKHENYELFKTKMPKSGLTKAKHKSTKNEETWWNSQTRRLFYLSMTYKTRENILLKSLIGFICGALITCLISFFCVLVLNTGAETAAVASSIGLSCCFLLGFNDRARGSMLMFLPRVFGSEGRNLLKLYLLILITAGPVKNTLRNSRILTNSATCVQEKAQPLLNAMENLIKRPIIPIEESLHIVLDKVKLVKIAAKEIMMTLKTAVMQIVGMIRGGFGFLNGVVNLCNRKVGSPFHRCLKSIELVLAECKANLESRYGGMGVCTTEYLVKDVCRVAQSKDLCAKVELLLPVSIVTNAVRGLKKLATHLRNMFDVSFVTEHDTNYRLYNGKSKLFRVYEEVTRITKTSSIRLDVLIQVIGFSMAVYGVYSVYSGCKYGKYVTRDWYDNHFITENLTVIDVNRKRSKAQKILFPLTRRECQKYVPMTTHELVRNEGIRYTSLPINYFLIIMMILIPVGFDLGLCWFLKRLHRIGHIPLEDNGLRNVEVLVNATGPIWDIYKATVDAFQPKFMGEITDLTTCFSNPYEPDYSRYNQIGLVTLAYTFISLLSPHGQRLRVLIIDHCYPLVAKRRAVWLYNHIQRVRCHSVKLARRRLRRKYHERGDEDAICIWKIVETEVKSWLIRYGEKLWGEDAEDEEDQKVCLNCECAYPPDTQLIKCSTLHCAGLYCDCCFAELGELCVLCRPPDEYGDLSDVSEEKDSSDEDKNFTYEDEQFSEMDSDWWISGMESEYDDCYQRFPRDPCDRPNFRSTCQCSTSCVRLNLATIGNTDLPLQDTLGYFIENRRHEEFSLRKRVNTHLLCSIAPDLCEKKIKFENPSWQVSVDEFLRDVKLDEHEKVGSLRRRASCFEEPRIIKTYFSGTIFNGHGNTSHSDGVSSQCDLLSNSPRENSKRKREEKCRFCQNLQKKRSKLMYPVHMNNFKSREGVSKERFSKSSKGSVRSARVKSAVGDKSSKLDRFEQRKVESPLARSHLSPRTTLLSSELVSSPRSSRGRSSISESMQRNTSSWRGQEVMGPKLDTTQEYSSSDESTVSRRPRRKNNKLRSSSKSSKSPSTRGILTGTGPQSWRSSAPSKSSCSLSYDADVGSLQMSSGSVNDYLANVSRELEQKGLLGKLDLSCVGGGEGGDGRSAASDKLNALTTNFMYVAEELKQKRLMGIRNAAGREKREAAMAHRNRMMKEDGATLWTRMRNVFSMGCWRGHTGHMTSDDQETGSEESGTEDSKLVSLSSSSTETTTVIPATCHARNARHGPDAANSRVSPRDCRDETFVAAKLVESLKRFFSINPKTDDGTRLLKKQTKPFEGIDEENESEHSEDNSETSVECVSTNQQPPSLPLPLPPYSTEESVQSTYTSDYEIVNINPKQRQPM